MKEKQTDLIKFTEVGGKDCRKMRRESGGDREVNGKAKQADNRDRKFYTTGDRDAKEEKQAGERGNSW